MEVEKKRKRGENGEKSNGGGGGGGRKKMEREIVKGEKAGSTPPPTEEEVEEFFAILRRMHAAIKYFEKNNSNGDGHKLTGRWTTALETEVLRGINGVHVRNDVGVARNGVFDLNAMPEAESNNSV